MSIRTEGDAEARSATGRVSRRMAGRSLLGCSTASLTRWHGRHNCVRVSKPRPVTSLYSLFAVVDDEKDTEACGSGLLNRYRVPAELGIGDELEAAPAQRHFPPAHRTVYAADVKQLTWRPGGFQFRSKLWTRVGRFQSSRRHCRAKSNLRPHLRPQRSRAGCSQESRASTYQAMSSPKAQCRRRRRRSRTRVARRSPSPQAPGATRSRGRPCPDRPGERA